MSNAETPPASSPSDVYDVVVIGGAFAGGAFATLLRRRLPGCRILVVERAERFTRRVGEATVEVSGHFLCRVLGLFDHLSRCQLPKHGLRYWFTDGAERSLDEMTEIGSSEAPRLASFQLDRAKLDEHLLATAAAEGCEVARPAKVTAVEHGWPASIVTYAGSDGERRVTARWVVDASGRQAFIARHLRLLERVEEHPTAAAWARWHGVADLDGTAVLGPDSRCNRLPDVAAARRLATNHFCGYGWWCWVIPLAGGETSVGMVYNKELFQLPGDGSLRERYEGFVRSQAGLRELLAGATIDGEDFMSYSHLPYKSRRYMERGWALVADAASFIDPYYSPGLDHASISIYATVQLLERELRGELDEAALTAAIERHNTEFLRSYDRWLSALYLGKYELMGDSELVASSFLVDTSFYYLGVVTPIYRHRDSLLNPIFGASLPQATAAYRIARAFNRRLLTLARFRRRAGLYGRRNIGHSSYARAFGLGLGSLRPLLRGLRIWLRLEREKLLYHLRHGPVDSSRPVPEVELAAAVRR